MKVINFIKKYSLAIFYFMFAIFLYFFAIVRNNELNLLILIFILMLISMGFLEVFSVHDRMDKKSRKKVIKIYQNLSVFFYIFLFIAFIVLFLLAGVGIIE